MFDALKGLFASKKFWLTVIGTVVITVLTAVLNVLNVDGAIMDQILTYVAGLFGVSLAGFGLQDFGKAKK